jgi:hypothetical protein
VSPRTIKEAWGAGYRSVVKQTYSSTISTEDEGTSWIVSEALLLLTDPNGNQLECTYSGRCAYSKLRPVAPRLTVVARNLQPLTARPTAKLAVVK